MTPEESRVHRRAVGRDPLCRQPITVRPIEVPAARVKCGGPWSPGFRRVEDSPSAAVVVADRQKITPDARVVDGVDALAATWVFQNPAPLRDISRPNGPASSVQAYQEFVSAAFANFSLGDASQHHAVV